MRYRSFDVSKAAAISASLTVTWALNASGVTGTTSSFTFSLRLRYSAATSASLIDIQPVSALRSFSICRARRRLRSKSAVVIGGFWNCRICR